MRAPRLLGGFSDPRTSLIALAGTFIQISANLLDAAPQLTNEQAVDVCNRLRAHVTGLLGVSQEAMDRIAARAAKKKRSKKKRRRV